MPDAATTIQVTKVVLGSQYMGILLAGRPLMISFPPQNPTHQFQIEIDEDTRKALTGGVTAVKKKVRRRRPKKQQPKSTRKKKPSR